MNKYAPTGKESELRFEADGAALSNEEAALLKERLRKNPDDLKAHLLLLGRGRRRDSRTSVRHLCWLIEKHPKRIVHSTLSVVNKKVYEQGRQYWMKQIALNPDDVTILVHAAQFLTLFHPENAIDLLLHACELDQASDELPRQLAHAYSQLTIPPGGGRFAQKAVEQIKIAVSRYAVRSDDDSYLLPRFSMEISSFANLAIDYQQYDSAIELAQLLMTHKQINEIRLGSACSHSDGVYQLSAYRGHCILGKTALRMNKLDLAEEHLRKMMQYRATFDTQYDFVGEWSTIGRNDLAIEYLDHCYKSWEQLEASQSDPAYAESQKQWLQKWIKQLKRKQTV